MIRLAYVSVPVPAVDDCADCGGSGVAESLVYSRDPESVRDRVCACVTEWLAERGDACCGGRGYVTNTGGLLAMCDICQPARIVWDV